MVQGPAAQAGPQQLRLPDLAGCIAGVGGQVRQYGPALGVLLRQQAHAREQGGGDGGGGRRWVRL